MEGERIVFTEEANPQRYIKLVASGEIDGLLLEALDDYVKRQRKRLAILRVSAGQAVKPEWADKTFFAGDHAPAAGVYQSHHEGHIGGGDIEMAKDDLFPRCNECVGGSARYEFR